MGFTVRKVNDPVLYAVVEAINADRAARVTTEIHNDVTADPVGGDPRSPTVGATVAITSANATDLPTLVTISNEIRLDYIAHIEDAVGHDAADIVNTIAAAVVTDLATAQTLLNEVKADYNAHRSEAGVHPNNDGGNAIAAADATNQGTAETLANEIKTDLTAHIALALAGAGVRLIAP